MLTLDELTELEPETGEIKQHMEQYLETFDTSLQSDTPYSDVTQVRKYIRKKTDGRKKWKKNNFIWINESNALQLDILASIAFIYWSAHFINFV